MKCRKCQGGNYSLFKAIYKNETKHYCFCCNDCFARYNIQSSIEVLNATRDQKWLRGIEIIKNRNIFAEKRKELQTKVGKRKKQQAVLGPYEDYLRSDYWMRLRESVYRRDRTCRVCNSDEDLQTHHRSYKHKGDFNKERKDLTLLCKECHELYHENKEIN